MHNQKNYYHLTYGQNYKDPEAPCWGFTRLQDLFEELDRIGENKVDIELAILDDNTKPIFEKLWKKIQRVAKTNGFTVNIYNTNVDGDFVSKGRMERKN
jgi:hypothetical protein